MNEGCKYHTPLFAHWCPMCQQLRKLAREAQDLEITKLWKGRHNIDLRPQLAKCARLP